MALSFGTLAGACGGSVAPRDDSADAATAVSATPDDGGAADLEGGATLLSSLDTPCGPAAVTGRQLLDQLLPQYSSPFAEEAPDGATVSTTVVTFGARYDGGAITCLLVTDNCGSGPGCARAIVPAYVELAVDVTFQTADGAFDDQFTGTAAWGGDSAEGVNILGYVPPTSLVGNLVPTGNPASVEFNLFVSRTGDGGVDRAVIGIAGSGGTQTAIGYGSFGD
jgi:hypothetical protein